MQTKVLTHQGKEDVIRANHSEAQQETARGRLREGSRRTRPLGPAVLSESRRAPRPGLLRQAPHQTPCAHRAGDGGRTRSNPSPAEAKVVFTLHFSVYDPTAFVLLEMSESFQKALKTVLVLREVNTEAEVPGPPASEPFCSPSWRFYTWPRCIEMFREVGFLVFNTCSVCNESPRA